jgi:hypothetical protein
MLKTINGGKMPTKGSKYSACVDLYANEDVCIGAGETKIVGLGVCIDIDSIRESEMFETHSTLASFDEPLLVEYDNNSFNEFVSTAVIQPEVVMLVIIHSNFTLQGWKKS